MRLFRRGAWVVFFFGPLWVLDELGLQLNKLGDRLWVD